MSVLAKLDQFINRDQIKEYKSAIKELSDGLKPCYNLEAIKGVLNVYPINAFKTKETFDFTVQNHLRQTTPGLTRLQGHSAPHTLARSQSESDLLTMDAIHSFCLENRGSIEKVQNFRNQYPDAFKKTLKKMHEGTTNGNIKIEVLGQISSPNKGLLK